MKMDIISQKTLKLIESSNEPLATKEIQEKLKRVIKDITRIKLFLRLSNLRGEGRIKGKFLEGGKGTWIWWQKNEAKE